jgi:hypothetical protein
VRVRDACQYLRTSVHFLLATLFWWRTVTGTILRECSAADLRLAKARSGETRLKLGGRVVVMAMGRRIGSPADFSSPPNSRSSASFAAYAILRF